MYFYGQFGGLEEDGGIFSIKLHFFPKTLVYVKLMKTTHHIVGFWYDMTHSLFLTLAMVVITYVSAT